jgi:hypothetical protein
LVFQDGHGNSETLPFKQIIYRDQQSEIDYMVVPFNDLYDNCNHVLPLLNKVLKNMQSQGLLKIRYKDGEANPMKHKRYQFSIKNVNG